ncbi:Multidrug resistance-associated protein 4 [Holothuria leucospilota]|uniref:Cystic fibrosis transmembrane conductance regulator n=1 Tax=Holothuria leucospilota TaxID=206669 RepID=A0A9Q1BRJ6_HOLLE|nr:Multidrug resistance-associated protein 4 [Holothuria leucospilota]
MASEKETEDINLDSQPNPIITTNFFSKLFFCWLLPLFKYGFKNTLERKHLYQTVSQDSSKHLADKLKREWDLELEKERKTGQKASLFKAIIRTCRVLVILNGFIVFFEECIFKMGQPILLGIFVQYFNEESNITTAQAYLCAIGMSVCAMGITILHHPSFFISSRVGMRIRVAVSALVYRKALRLSNTALGKTTVGQLVNILSNDVNRFDLAFLFVHYMWIAPIQIITMLCVLWFQMGPTCLIAFFTLLLMAPVQAFMGKMFSQLRAKTALLTDERVRIMNEIIAGMRIIKIHAWEVPFTKLVEEARRRESLRIQRTSYLRSFNLSFFFIASKLVAFTTFTLFAALGNVITTTVVFIAIPMFDIVRLTVTLFVPYCIMHCLEGLVSVKRIKAFLIMDELHQPTGALDSCNSQQNHLYHTNGDSVALQALGLNSNHTNEHVAFTNHANKVTPSIVMNGEAMVVVDPKTELAVTDPGMDEKPKNSDDYTIQIRDLNGSWDEEGTGVKCLDRVTFSVKQKELVAVIGPVGCGKSSLFMALLGELPNITGQVSVKGRAAYTSQQPWVFSGTLKENILFGRPFDKKKYQRAISICALTRDIAILPEGDLTMIGERGVTLSGGQRARVSLARAVYDDADIYLLDDPLSAVDTAVGRHLFDRCISGHLQNKSVILITHQLQYLHTVDKIVILKEGEMVDCGTYDELQKKGIDFAALLKEYEDETEEADEDTAGKLSRTQSVTSRESEAASPEDVAFTDDYSEVERKETKKEGTVNRRVYSEFFRAGGTLPSLFCFMVFNFAAQVFFVLSDWWLSEWAYIEENCSLQFDADRCLNEPAVLGNFTDFRVDKIGRPFFFYIFTVFIVLLIIFAFTRTVWLFFILVTASKNLHNQMFKAVIRTPMQFFDTNPIGRILNRFSKDIGFMDELLPITIADFNAIAVQTLAILITICIFNPLVLIFTVPLIILFAFVRSYFLATSRDVKRIEGVCRSPVFSHLSSTLQGLTTVRAFHAQNRFVAKFDMYQDVHTESWFTFLATTRWFGIMLDWMTAIFLIIVAFGSVVSKDLLGLNAAEVGLSLTYALSLMGAFQWGVRQSAEVENLMTSTERVLEYTKLKPEADVESKEKLDPEWPKEGAVEFKDVSLKYSEDGPLVLKEINMKIAPKEKIGIVGRTGAGKSSLTVALMRLVEPMGTITIDGVDLSGLGLHDVRKKVAFIPQDPTLFSGTLRRNLDPFSDHDDESLWGALKEVQLQPVVEEYPEKLEMKVSEGGNNFSVGQRQLLCLARAILRKNRVLLVDEATANVDIRTDELIQATIREKFKDCTVFTIAHRLNTIMDSDRVLVLEEGQVVEFDKPHILLQNSNGFLSGMVAETGNQEANKLKVIARQTYYEMVEGEENDETLGKGKFPSDEGTSTEEGEGVEEEECREEKRCESDKEEVSPKEKDGAETVGEENKNNISERASDE